MHFKVTFVVYINNMISNMSFEVMQSYNVQFCQTYKYHGNFLTGTPTNNTGENPFAVLSERLLTALFLELPVIQGTVRFPEICENNK